MRKVVFPLLLFVSCITSPKTENKGIDVSTSQPVDVKVVGMEVQTEILTDIRSEISASVDAQVGLMTSMKNITYGAGDIWPQRLMIIGGVLILVFIIAGAIFIRIKKRINGQVP